MELVQGRGGARWRQRMLQTEDLSVQRPWGAWGGEGGQGPWEEAEVRARGRGWATNNSVRGRPSVVPPAAGPSPEGSGGISGAERAVPDPPPRPCAHSYRALATEHEALMQKYLHLLQIVETEKTVAKQLRRQIEDGEVEIERLKAEVTAGRGRALRLAPGFLGIGVGEP